MNSSSRSRQVGRLKAPPSPSAWRKPWDAPAGSLESTLRATILALRVEYNEFRRWRIKRCLRRAAWLCAPHEAVAARKIGFVVQAFEDAGRIERNAVHIMVSEDSAALADDAT